MIRRMHEGVGIGLIAGGAAVAFAVAFALRTRAPGAAVATILATAGAAIGVGASLVQHRVSATNWALTVAAMTALVPAHVRVVLGRFGPPGER